MLDPLHLKVGTHNTIQTQGQTTTDISDRKINITVKEGKPSSAVNCPEANSDQTEENK